MKRGGEQGKGGGTDGPSWGGGNGNTGEKKLE